MMRNFDLKHRMSNALPIAAGTAVYAFGLHYFIIPNHLMEGGVTGIALLLNYIFNIPPSFTTLILNLPLFYFGWRIFGKNMMGYTIWGTLCLSFFLWMMEIFMNRGWIVPFTTSTDVILVALYAGVTIGGGLGLVFRYGGTTGGVDILARLAQLKKGWSVGQVIFAVDLIVIGSSLFYIPLPKILYTLVTAFIASRVIDTITEGSTSARAYTIVTEKGERIAETITRELDRGVTLIPAKGAFSKQDKEIVYCVVYRPEMRRMKELVKQIDPKAFIIINEVHDVLGEGFKSD
jgi:uncharacterized membrane-anchored protein YitT (DUF2179 family)